LNFIATVAETSVIDLVLAASPLTENQNAGVSRHIEIKSAGWSTRVGIHSASAPPLERKHSEQSPKNYPGDHIRQMIRGARSLIELIDI